MTDKVKEKNEKIIWVKLDGGVWWPRYQKGGQIRFWEEEYIMDPASEIIQPFKNDKGLRNNAREKLKKKKWLLKKFEQDLKRATSSYADGNGNVETNGNIETDEKTCDNMEMDEKTDGNDNVETDEKRDGYDNVKRDGNDNVETDEKTDGNDNVEIDEKTDGNDNVETNEKTDGNDNVETDEKTDGNDNVETDEKTDGNDNVETDEKPDGNDGSGGNDITNPVDGDEELFSSDDSVRDTDYVPDSLDEDSDSDCSAVVPLFSEHLKPSVSTSPASPVSVKRNIENYSDETLKRLKTDSNDRSDSPPPEADILRDENIKGIYIRKFKLKKPREFKGQSKTGVFMIIGMHVYFVEKLFYILGCIYKPIKPEEEVKDQSNLPRLRKLGDDKHNRKTIDRGEGEIFLARRPTDSFNIANYGPCPACREWVKLKGLKEHHLECTKGKPSIKSRKKDLVVLSQVLAGHIQSKQSPIMQKEVLTIMKDDIISKIAQEDALITALGESLLRRNVCSIEKRKYYASARMRLCAKLLQNLRELKLKPKTDESKDPHSLWDFLRPQCFEEVVLCSLKCSFPSADDIEDLQSPSNILKLKHDIRNTVNSKWAFIVKSVGTESNIEAKECRTFLQLMEVKWREKAQTLVRAVLNRRRYEEVKELPSPSDIECLTGHLNLELRNLTLTSENFRRLVVVVQTKLLLFNKRRSGELEAIKLHSYVSRSTGLNDIDQSLANDLSDVEKHMMETQDLMKVRGKRGRPVPVLVPKNCRLPLAFLADQTSRRDSGVRPENTYLFPNSVNSYARAYDSLKEICSEVNLVAPHRITSVSMRKYTATLTQVEWVCNHLGHTTKVHKEHYRQMSGLLERTQISKLLLIQDLNLTSKYKGKKLEDMDIRDIIFPDAKDLDEAAVPKELSVPYDSTEDEEEKDDSDSESESEVESVDNFTTTKIKPKIKPKPKRQRWTSAEISEIKLYFEAHLKSGITPRSAEVDKAKSKSKKKNGQIHLRANHLIVKKISNMNHS